MPVRFHPAARAELVGARDWYERAREGLGSISQKKSTASST
jgi:hypothetical protein